MRIILGITSSISAYKTPDLVRRFCKRGTETFCVVTKNARHLVGIKALETVSGNRVIVDLNEAKDPLTHINLSRDADAFLIAPATANMIAKLAAGIADDAVSTMALAFTGARFFAPAMNSEMWKNAATVRNVASLLRDGWRMIPPEEGDLACGVTDVGRLADLNTIVDTVLGSVSDLAGKHFIVTAGSTREWIDDIRFIANRSSGKMGRAIHDEIRKRGGVVVYIEAQVSARVHGPHVIGVDTTKELQDAVLRSLPNADCLIMAAAPLDFRPKTRAEGKLKKGGMNAIELIENDDILKRVREADAKIAVVAFAAESSDLAENAKAKLSAKGANIIIANTVSDGFGTDDDRITVIRTDGTSTEHKKMSKRDCAKEIVNEARALIG
ncbi:MAG: bifunctional phosphopantothenoylcysteine decarboxylase/phosphopantothenate--cysteine ligase CoaBC [Spirochaetota bacterium]